MAGDNDPDWDPDRYDDGHAFVFEYGEDVLDLLAPAAGERVLDLGCGTGHLTRRIADAGANPVGVDRAADMLARARESHPDLPFVRADARSLPVGADFDAVFSNAALHWIPDADQDAALASIRAALRPGGRFVAELGGAGNVATIADAIRDAVRARGYDPADPWYFPSVGEYASRVEAHGLEVRHAGLFDRPTPLDGGHDGLREWIAMFAEGFLDPLGPDERPATIREVEERLEPSLYRDGTWVADYRRLRIVARRPVADE